MGKNQRLMISPNFQTAHGQIDQTSDIPPGLEVLNSRLMSGQTFY